MRNATLTALPLALAAICYSTSSHAWDHLIVHAELTRRAADFAAASDASYAGLKDHSRFPVGDHNGPQCHFIDEGSVKEDFSTLATEDYGVWGQPCKEIPTLSCLAHGYNPVTEEAWYGLPDVQGNAIGRAEDVWDLLLRSQNPYFQAGRIAHLIEDMASPAHAHADLHATGDDMEEWGMTHYYSVQYETFEARKPSTHGLNTQGNLPHGDNLREDNVAGFMRNVAWRTYYMTSYQTGKLVTTEGDQQPDSELKRMFPYRDSEQRPTGLRYDSGGWFGNDSWLIDDIGQSWIGIGIGHSDWWPCPEDEGYAYIENIDGDESGTEGPGVVPMAFKAEPFRRILLGDNLDAVLSHNGTTLNEFYANNLFPMVTSWVAGFLQEAHTARAATDSKTDQLQNGNDADEVDEVDETDDIDIISATSTPESPGSNGAMACSVHETGSSHRDGVLGHWISLVTLVGCSIAIGRRRRKP